MPGVIDPETLHVDELPGVWTPVQWEQTREEHAQELEAQAEASLLRTVDIPEAILRLLLNETDIENLYAPPDGYDPAQQGEWDPNLITFAFLRPVKLESVRRERDSIEAVYNFGDRGWWSFEIEPEKVTIQRI